MTPDLSIVIPTISGREEWLRRCVGGYKLLTPDAVSYEFVIVKDQPSCGHAWIEGYKLSQGKYVHFTADDITPAGLDWWRKPMWACDNDIVPSANVMTPGGGPAVCDSPLGDMGLWPNVLVPFLSRKQLELDDWDNTPGWLLPIHYGSDDWVTYRAVQLGFKVQRFNAYAMTHFVAPEGRNYIRRHADVKTLVDYMEAAGYVPPVYEALERNLRDSATGLDAVRINQLDFEARAQLRTQRNEG